VGGATTHGRVDRAKVLVVVGWHLLLALRPDLAAAGRRLLYQFGVGLAFLATVRRDGGPRAHPICPLIVDDRLVAFIVPSPKLEDLRRDGRYALHSFPCADNEDAFYLTGRAAVLLDEPRLRTDAASLFLAERNWADAPPGFDDQVLVEFLIETCLLTTTTGHGDPDPQHTVWTAPAEPGDPRC
jgi:hypothetical protein